MRYLLALVVLCAAFSAATADDIVSMPTANQLKAGQVDVAAYYFWLKNPSAGPQYDQLQTVYLGLTDRIELDAHRSAVDYPADETSVVLVGSFKVLSESATKPDLVFGCKNLGGVATTEDDPRTAVDERDKSKDRSYFLSGAKTLFLKPGLMGPPLVRVHLSIGTADWTMMNQARHKGVFGGLQFLFMPQLGAVIQHDGTDLITGITFMPPNTGLTIKGGTFGDHRWFGVAWRYSLK